MTHEEEQHIKNDIAHNWVSTSRFLYYLHIACFVAMVIGGSYELYRHHFQTKPAKDVQGSTKYTPEYK